MIPFNGISLICFILLPQVRLDFCFKSQRSLLNAIKTCTQTNAIRMMIKQNKSALTNANVIGSTIRTVTWTTEALFLCLVMCLCVYFAVRLAYVRTRVHQTHCHLPQDNESSFSGLLSWKINNTLACILIPLTRTSFSFRI